MDQPLSPPTFSPKGRGEQSVSFRISEAAAVVFQGDFEDVLIAERSTTIGSQRLLTALLAEWSPNIFWDAGES